MDYRERFKNIPVEIKRQDLMIHPMVDKEKIRNATDQEIEKVHRVVFSILDASMREVVGESLFEEEW